MGADTQAARERRKTGRRLIGHVSDHPTPTSRRPTMSTSQWAEDTAPGRRFVRLPVARTLSGEVSLPLHVVTGANPGPTLALTAAIHGDETTPIMMMRDLLDGLDPAALSGRVLAVPVCNPPAVGAFGRQTPEQHGKT